MLSNIVVLKFIVNKNIFIIKGGCVIKQIQEVLEKNCEILRDPMGKPDTAQMSRKVPFVHPTIKVSEDHFAQNTAFADGTCRALEDQRSAYKNAEEVKFDDVIGLVFQYKVDVT